MPKFGIFYGDGTEVYGTSRGQWRNAPDTGVQVIIDYDVTVITPKWCSFSNPEDPHNSTVENIFDKEIYTGVETYDPFGWGPKAGSLIDVSSYRAAYKKMAERKDV